MAATNLQIVLPEVVTIDTLRSALAVLPIVPRRDQKSDEVTHFEFAPPPSMHRLEFDTSQVQILTAEAAVAYTAFSDWLTRQVGSSMQLVFSKDRWLTPARAGVGPQAKYGKLLILPRRIKLPNLSQPHMASNSPPEYIAEIAMKIARIALQEIKEASALSEYDVSIWLFEFIYEGLLNVAQHSAGTPQDSRVEAYVAVSWIRAETLARAEPKVRSATTSERASTKARLDWFEHALTSNEWVLEVAIADNGRGFRNGLRDRLDKDDSDLTAQLMGLSGRARFRALQDAAIAWALSPFGTRKDSNFFSNKSIAESWRGLFRVLFHTMRLGGLVAVSSGHGYLLTRHVK